MNGLRNMAKFPDQAFILAAGFGTRMRPLTDNCPKPLLPVKGKPIVHHTLDKMEQAPIRQVVMNGHYLKDQVESFVQNYSGQIDLHFSHEEEILDTGGGVVKAGQQLDLDKDLFCVLGDSLWQGDDIFKHLSDHFDATKMDFLLALFPVNKMINPPEKGDFHQTEEGRLSWDGDKPYMYMGVCLVAGGIFADQPMKNFSMKDLWNTSMDAGRLYGLEYPSNWYHLSTPKDIEMFESLDDQ